MLCPLKKANSVSSGLYSVSSCLCSGEKYGFYSRGNQQCAFASLADIASEITELKSALNHTTETLDDMNKRLIMLYEVKKCSES